VVILAKSIPNVIKTFKMYSLDEKLDAYLAHCGIKWGVFIMSMKSCIGTGRGQTYPNGVYIEFDE